MENEKDLQRLGKLVLSFRGYKQRKGRNRSCIPVMHDGLHTCVLPAGKLHISSLGLEASPERANPAASENTLTGEEEALNPTRTAIRLDGNDRIRPLYNLHDDTIDGVEICHVIPGSFWDELRTRTAM